MKVLTGLTFPSNRSLVLLGILVTLLSFCNVSKVFAEEPAATSSEAAPESYQDNWWRSIRKGMWKWEGANWTAVKNTLARIESATGKRRYQDKFDTIIVYGPGHWVYEWSITGDEAYKEGLKQEKNGNGPEVMYTFVLAELVKLGIPKRRVRVEVFGPPSDVTREPAWPETVRGDTFFQISLKNGPTLKAKAGEPLMNSLERFKITLTTSCRSGECSLCRTKLLSGKVFHPSGVKLRKSDRAFGYIHPCMAYPLENLELLL